ncbi:Monocarboxylate Transporter 14 [Manis pentadactyla]|nr:Monocarboxylate Transporter 14 [Manis pentadactyla]
METYLKLCLCGNSDKQLSSPGSTSSPGKRLEAPSPMRSTDSIAFHQHLQGDWEGTTHEEKPEGTDCQDEAWSFVQNQKS